MQALRDNKEFIKEEIISMFHWLNEKVYIFYYTVCKPTQFTQSGVFTNYCISFVKVFHNHCQQYSTDMYVSYINWYVLRFLRLRRAAIVLQKHWRGRGPRIQYNQMRRGYMRLQALIRSRVLKANFAAIRRHVSGLQVRYHNANVWHEH